MSMLIECDSLNKWIQFCIKALIDFTITNLESILDLIMTSKENAHFHQIQMTKWNFVVTEWKLQFSWLSCDMEKSLFFENYNCKLLSKARQNMENLQIYWRMLISTVSEKSQELFVSSKNRYIFKKKNCASYFVVVPWLNGVMQKCEALYFL